MRSYRQNGILVHHSNNWTTIVDAADSKSHYPVTNGTDAQCLTLLYQIIGNIKVWDATNYDKELNV